jgi:rfaE bifunctional protein kinase chain/domain
VLISRSVHPLPGEAKRRARFVSLVDAFNGRRVLIVGDLIADEFIYGQVARVSREAPVLILQYDATEILPGGAGNAANNVAALSGRAHLIGLTGGDEPGRRLVQSLRQRVQELDLVRPAGYVTPVKTRILAGGVHTAKQQVVRIDRQLSGDTPPRILAEVARKALSASDRCDAVLVSDYGSGLVTPELVEKLRARLTRRSRRRPVPMIVDSRYDLLSYKSLTACTPNEAEVEHMLGVRIDDRLDVLERAGRQILRRTHMNAVFITRGSRGMTLFEPGRPTVHIPIFGSDQVADVTGAGDTVIATVTLALAAGASFYEAARLANYTGGLVVMKRGTATVSPAELRDAIEGDHQLATPDAERAAHSLEPRRGGGGPRH